MSDDLYEKLLEEMLKPLCEICAAEPALSTRSPLWHCPHEEREQHQVEAQNLLPGDRRVDGVVLLRNEPLSLGNRLYWDDGSEEVYKPAALVVVERW